MADEIMWEAPPEPTWRNRPRVGTSRGVDRETGKGTLYVRYVGSKGGE